MKDELRKSRPLYAARAVAAGLNALSLILSVRVMSVADYASFGVVMAVANMVRQVFDFRTLDILSEAFARGRAAGDERPLLSAVGVAGRLDLGVVGVSVLSLWLGAEYLSTFFASRVSPEHLRMGGVVLCGTALASVARGVLGLRERYVAVAKAEVVLAVSTLLGFAVAAIAGRDVTAFLLATVIANVVTVVGLLRAARPEIGGSWMRALSQRGEARVSRRLLVATNVLSSVRLLQTQLPVVLVARLSSSEREIAAFVLSLRIGGYVSTLASPLTTVLRTTIASAVGRGSWWDDVRRAAWALSAPLLGLAICFAIASPFAVPLLFGQQYVGTHHSAALAFAGNALGVGGLLPAMYLLTATGRVASLILASALASALQIAMLVAFVPSFGAVAAAISHCAYFVIVCAGSWVAVIRMKPGPAKPAH
jgi:O-antigen/teichoic acid export membrane protein